MVDIKNDIASLTDFKQNTSEHLANLKKSGRPEVLTVNGTPEVVIQDVGAYQDLLAKAELMDTANAIQKGIAAHDRGEGTDMRNSIESIAKKHGIQLEK